MGFPCGSVVKSLPANAGDARDAQSLSQEYPLEKEMATQSSILAWEILWIEYPCGWDPWGCKESDATDHTPHRFTWVNLIGIRLIDKSQTQENTYCMVLCK